MGAFLATKTVMWVIYSNEKMQFYPPVEDQEETALFVVTQICKTMQHVSLL